MRRRPPASAARSSELGPAQPPLCCVADFFRPVPRVPWLGHGGHPRTAVPACAGADFLSWKRKYQAIKKLYAAEAVASGHGCGLLWLVDSESFALRRFSFARDVFGSYLEARPTMKTRNSWDI